MKKTILLLLGTALLVLWILWGNRALMVRQITVRDPEVPAAFSGFRLAHISDLHNTEFGPGNERLLSLLRESAPDVIVITGDLVDSRRTDIPLAVAFAEQAVKIAPCYYVTGNHESRIATWPVLEKGLTEAGVHVLRDAGTTLERQGAQIRILGVDDPKFDRYESEEEQQSLFRKRLEALPRGEADYTILLSHRPERMDDYAELGFDLVFSGHAHGGQFRIPFLGGVFVPDQGFFPEYDSGLYEKDDTAMIVSRGLGNSRFPFRLNNRPELILAVLETE